MLTHRRSGKQRGVPGAVRVAALWSAAGAAGRAARGGGGARGAWKWDATESVEGLSGEARDKAHCQNAEKRI